MKNNAIFFDFNDSEHNAFCDITSEKEYPAGYMVVKDGSALDKLYIIKKGIVEVNVFEESNKVILGRLSDGEIFGEMSFIDELTASANIVSLTNVILWEIKRDSLLNLLEIYPNISVKLFKNLFRILSKRLRFTSSYLASNDYLLSEVKKKNEELEKMNVKLKELSDIKNEFLGIAAHDIRNPLSTILAYAQFLNSHNNVNIEEKRDYFLEKITSQGNFILNIINDLLDISKIEAGKLTLTLAECDFGKIIAESFEFNKLLASQKGISFIMHEPLPSNTITKIDRDRIKEVLNNLYSNAIKFSKSNTSVITKLETNEVGVTVSIRDHGIGIASDKVKLIFNPFTIAHEKSVSGEKSTGLGLAIVKKIVELHGGKVWVESYPGKGSAFSFLIPFNSNNTLT